MTQTKIDPDKPVALIDLDGTLANFDFALEREMGKLRSPYEPPMDPAVSHDDEPDWLRARRDLIKRTPGFWRTLPKIDVGFEVLDVIRSLGFRLVVLSNGPAKIPAAWAEKVSWCREHVPDADVTVGRDKGLVYGRVLFDDWPPYIERWLRWRPRGLVIMLDHPHNQAFQGDPRVLRYTGVEQGELRERLARAAGRCD